MSYRSERGARAEQIVCDHLTRLGWQILGRNMRVGPLEVDIVARRADLVVVCEVRTRGGASYVNALATVDWKKRDRLIRAARGLWRRFIRDLPGAPRMRLDVAEVRFDGPHAWRIQYVEGAFTAQSDHSW